MDKAQIIIELINLRSEIVFESDMTRKVKKAICNRLSGIIVDLMDDVRKDEELQAVTHIDCSNCPAIKKVDNLADAIDQGYMISKRIGQHFKVECIENELKTVEKVIESYGIGPHIGFEEAEKMARGGTD